MSLPPSALRLDPLILERLHKLGFYTIENFIHTPRSALRRRFGVELLLRIDQALGNVEERLQMLHPQQPYSVRLSSLEAVRTRSGIEIAIKELLHDLCKRLYDDGKGLRTGVLKCFRVDGKTLEVKIGSNRASHHAAHLFKLFELKIETIKPGLGIELFTLDAPLTEDVDPVQEALWLQENSGLDQVGLAELLDTISNKIGSDKIHRYLPVERHWPEQSIRLATSIVEQPGTAWRKDRPRPSLLLPKPESIEVTALLPDNPPMLFIYNGVRHNVVKADDAERIERPWWDSDGQHRDYYIVEDEQGRRYWIFRSGHFYENNSAWFIHGFFA